MLPCMEYLPTFGIDSWDECGSNIRTSHLAHLGFSSEIRRSIATTFLSAKESQNGCYIPKIFTKNLQSSIFLKFIEVKRDANLIVESDVLKMADFQGIYTLYILYQVLISRSQDLTRTLKPNSKFAKIGPSLAHQKGRKEGTANVSLFPANFQQLNLQFQGSGYPYLKTCPEPSTSTAPFANGPTAGLFAPALLPQIGLVGW